jgi:hypothetical protein
VNFHHSNSALELIHSGTDKSDELGCSGDFLEEFDAICLRQMLEDDFLARLNSGGCRVPSQLGTKRSGVPWKRRRSALRLVTNALGLLIRPAAIRALYLFRAGIGAGMIDKAVVSNAPLGAA